MKRFAAAALAALAAPGVAHAAGVSLAARDLPLRQARVLTGARSPGTFDLVGLHWQGSGKVLFRTRSVSGPWSAWHTADSDDQVGSWHLGQLYWTGTADRLDYRVAGAVRRVRAYYVWSPVDAVPYRTLSIAGSPQIIPRYGWQADEEIRRGPPLYAPSIRLAIVHHTAGTNNYGPLQSAAIVKGIELYHVEGNGWKDIGYNFLVDKYGQVFEGRYGGMTRNVIGAHAAGFNTGSVGVAIIGNYESRPISKAAEQALVKLLAWRLDLAHVDPTSALADTSLGNPRFPAGVPVFLRAISGHRDTGFTDCPGNALYRRLPTIAREVAATGLPKLYAAVAAGKLGGTIVFTGRLSAALPWTVTVTRGGQLVARGSGSGTAISWSWNSGGVPRAPYTWTMASGTSVRPATGAIGAAGPPPPPAPTTPPLPLLSALTVTPGVISPNGDGFADSAVISYALGVHGAVTAQLLDSNGGTALTLFSSQPQSAKLQSFPFAGLEPIADGYYTLRVSALADDGRNTTLDATVVIDRTLSSVAASPSPLTPGGTITFAFGLAKPAQATVAVQQGSTVVATVFQGELQPGPQTFTWDGATSAGPAPPGHYDLVVTTVDDVGTVSQSAGFDVAPS
jgi:hypothetical protein